MNIKVCLPSGVKLQPSCELDFPRHGPVSKSLNWLQEWLFIQTGYGHCGIMMSICHWWKSFLFVPDLFQALNYVSAWWKNQTVRFGCSSLHYLTLLVEQMCADLCRMSGLDMAVDRWTSGNVQPGAKCLSGIHPDGSSAHLCSCRVCGSPMRNSFNFPSARNSGSAVSTSSPSACKSCSFRQVWQVKTWPLPYSRPYP